MSEDYTGESESMKAARNVPPLPRERKLAGDGMSSLSMAMPLLLSAGGAIAAALLAEKANGSVSRTARRVRDESEGWYDSASEHLSDWGESISDTVSTGAKAAGVAGLLKAIGSGNLSSAGVAAAKALAAKKVAEYAASGAKSAGKFAKRHPAMTAAGATASLKARNALHDGSEYVSDHWNRLRGRKPEPQSNTSENLTTGLAILAVGAAAMYLFHPDQGRHRRRVLRENVMTGGKRVGTSLQTAYESTSHAVGDSYDDLRRKAETAYHAAVQRGTQITRSAKDTAQEKVEQAKGVAKEKVEQAKDFIDAARNDGGEGKTEG